MTYKDLLAVFDGDPRSRDRLLIAADLAVRFDAHLVGLYVTTIPQLPPQPSYLGATLLDPMCHAFELESGKRAESMRLLFEDIVARHSLSAEWREATGYPAEVAAVHGRYADLIVLGQCDAAANEAGGTPMRPEEVALLVGRPILVLPYAGHFAAIGRHVLIAWDAGREATRAVNDALPLLAGAASVTVIAVDPRESAGGGHGAIPGADIALPLARHGVAVRTERATSNGIGIGNTLLSRVNDLGADLLVMGAYGHSRLREVLLGGVTRTILESMTVPVLMAH